MKTIHKNSNQFSAPRIKKISIQKSSQNLAKNCLLNARKLINNLPIILRKQAEDPYGANCLVFAILLDQKSEIRNIQLKKIASEINSRIYKKFGFISKNKC